MLAARVLWRRDDAPPKIRAVGTTANEALLPLNIHSLF